MKPNEIVHTLNFASRAFVNHVMDAKTYDLWFELFREYSAEEFTAAMFAAIKEPDRVYFPSPGEVQKYLSLQEISPFELWNEIIKNYRLNKDEFLSKYPEDEPLRIAINNIGWNNIALADINKELYWLKKDFLQIYKEARESQTIKQRYVISHRRAKYLLNKIGELNNNSNLKQLSNQIRK